MDQQFLAEHQFKAITLKKDAVDTNVDIVRLIATNEFTEAKLAAAELLDQLDELEKMAHEKKRNDRLDLHIDYRNRSFMMMVPK